MDVLCSLLAFSHQSKFLRELQHCSRWHFSWQVLGALRRDHDFTVITAPELNEMGEPVTKNGVTKKLAYAKQDTLLIDDVTSEPILCILLNSKDGG